ncbi:MAG: CDP-diacylglycerol--glycerol-3-phosphate 3-phosphatidyltransferase [Bryobacteraceae bacterium]
MNVPNALTLLRIFFVPLLVAVLVQEDVNFRVGPVVLTNELCALAIFLTAAGTDLLDGYLARRWKQITTVGTLLDPIADKLLISAALISMVQVKLVPAWMAILIVGREFAVSGLRSIAAAEGYVIKANDWGKTKLVTQVIAISLLLLSIRWPGFSPAAKGCLWVVVVTSILSAFVLQKLLALY